MTGRELFEVWAPPESIWSRWVKPVLFAEPDPAPTSASPPPAEEPWPTFRVSSAADTAVVVDLPGAESVGFGVALARAGFRPVPLYNTGSHAFALVDVKPILDGLRRGAGEVQELALRADAPPAFLLDADRLAVGRQAEPGRFDNRWVVFPQDFPSSNLLRSQGIRRILVLRKGDGRPGDDLAHVLLRWQEAGLELLSQDPAAGGLPQPLRVSRPSGFRRLWYRSLTLMGLKRNSAGGFGSVIPIVTSTGLG